MRIYKRIPAIERFWTHVKKTDYCWLWIGARLPKGYGVFGADERYAHRFAFKYFKNAIPVGMLVLHKCDNPPCVNPSHLFLGTHLDNLRDMYKKGRGINGEKNGQAKLTDGKVLKILKSYKSGLLSCEAIARAFLVSNETVRLIIRRKRWKHVSF